MSAEIILNNVSFHLANTGISFKDVSLSFSSNKSSLVGDNGCGKTTFLKLLYGILKPDNGVLLRRGKISLVRQLDEPIAKSQSIAEVLNIQNILEALSRIEQGICSEDDFALCEDNWDLRERVKKIFHYFSFNEIGLDFPFSALSSGEKTKIRLMKPLLDKADFILFDEPTNNLDSDSREFFYDYVRKLSIGAIFCSHDRALLELVDETFTLSPLGLKRYGGNYSFYRAQKKIEDDAVLRLLKNKKNNLKIIKNNAQNRIEKHQKNQVKGFNNKKLQIKAKGQYNKIEINSKKGKSEKSNQRIRKECKRRLALSQSRLKEIDKLLEDKEILKFKIPELNLTRKKQLLKVKNLSFGYNQHKLLFSNISFSIAENERIAVLGKNGHGKSTLLKLIVSKLDALSGDINLTTKNYVYLVDFLSNCTPHNNLIENYLFFNSQSSVEEAHRALAVYKFRSKDALKPYSSLSGGEKVRAALAIHLMKKNAPELLILDEPTNHLDINAIEILEQALSAYKGAILCISHDDSFLKNIGIQQKISLSN